MEATPSYNSSCATVKVLLSCKHDNPSCLQLQLKTSSKWMDSSFDMCKMLLPESNTCQPSAAPYDPIYPPFYPWMRKRIKGVYPSSRHGCLKRRIRATYSQNQRRELEKEFHFAQYITLQRRAQIAKSIQLTERQVKVWFQNRRVKYKKDLDAKNERILPHKVDSTNQYYMPAHGETTLAFRQRDGSLKT